MPLTQPRSAERLTRNSRTAACSRLARGEAVDDLALELDGVALELERLPSQLRRFFMPADPAQLSRLAEPPQPLSGRAPRRSYVLSYRRVKRHAGTCYHNGTRAEADGLAV